MSYKFSVIVPVYNAEKYLARCVESILEQSYADFEIILVDDGSSDGSAIVCQQFTTKDSRIRYVWQKNQGAGAARRAGVIEARGEYIFFVDSDDYLSVDALQNQSMRRFAYEYILHNLLHKYRQRMQHYQIQGNHGLS